MDWLIHEEVEGCANSGESMTSNLRKVRPQLPSPETSGILACLSIFNHFDSWNTLNNVCNRLTRDSMSQVGSDKDVVHGDIENSNAHMICGATSERHRSQ